MKKLFILLFGVFCLMALTHFSSCKKEEEEPDVIASFTYTIDNVDFKKVTFTNASQNFSALAWNFGDNSTSTETNPVHTYVDLGVYTVTLTATSTEGGKTDVYSTTVTISDPNAELTKLVGETSKTWKLLRVVDNKRYPMEVGPYDHSTIWWAVGKDNDELAGRPCQLNDEWTFFRDGTMEFNDNGDCWGEGGIFDTAYDNHCEVPAHMIGITGEDLTPWSSGTHEFELVNGTEPKLKAIGNGAFIGFFKSATEYEVTKLTPMVQDSVIYNLIKLTDDAVDTLIIETNYYFEVGQPNYGGYWRYVLVHYDDPNAEPPIPQPSPVPGFTFTVDGMNATFTNTTKTFSLPTTYLWDFGDGSTSTSENPVHPFAADGYYYVNMTATNVNGSQSLMKPVWIDGNSPDLTDDLLQGDPWTILVGEKTIFVGPEMGSADWWAVPEDFLTGGGTGGDDWSCIVDDEFTFSAGGVYTYDSKGTVRNDGYFGSPNGCWNEADLTGNAAAFKSGSHTYAFTPAAGTSRAIITLTNGTGLAAFIGFYKGYYGGENSTAPGPEQPLPNGGNATNQYEVMGYIKTATMEYLYVTVDITPDHLSTSSWSAILYR